MHERFGRIFDPRTMEPDRRRRRLLKQLCTVEERRAEEEQVDRSVRGDCRHHLKEVPTGKRGEAEQDQAVGEVEWEVVTTDAIEERAELFRWARLVDPGSQVTPHPLLPRKVRRELRSVAVDGMSLRPRLDHLRSVEVVAVEEVRDRPDAREARCALGKFGELSLGGSIVEFLEHGQERPDHPVDVPRVWLAAIPSVDDRIAECARERSGDVGGNAVSRTGGGGSQIPGQLERQPAPHAFRRNGQPL